MLSVTKKGILHKVIIRKRECGMFLRRVVVTLAGDLWNMLIMYTNATNIT